MLQEIEILAANPEIDQKKLDHLMHLSGELVIIRSQYARTEKLLQLDLSRQKELSQGIDQARILLDSVSNEPARSQKIVNELKALINKLDQLSLYDQVIAHIQGLAHTTSSLEKTSSDLQSNIIKLRVSANGGKINEATSMSIVPALLVVVGQEICAFPLAAVTEIINVPKQDIYTVDGNATMKLRDHALSLVELSSVIQSDPSNKTDNPSIRRVVVITDGQDKLGIIVDSLLGKDEIVLKSLTKHFSRVKGIVGASILADGNVALVLDPATIIKESR